MGSQSKAEFKCSPNFDIEPSSEEKLKEYTSEAIEYFSTRLKAMKKLQKYLTDLSKEST
jgi:hypothetical protein